MGRPFEQAEAPASQPEASAEALQRQVYSPTERAVPPSKTAEDDGFLGLPSVDISDRAGDAGKEKVKLEDTYKTKDAQKAASDALSAGVPLVVHVGATWCGACRKMEADVWPKIEKEFKGKAAFLHLDLDEVKEGTGGDVAKRLVDKVTTTNNSYPTIMIIDPRAARNGAVDVDRLVKKSPQEMDVDETRKFLQALK